MSLGLDPNFTSNITQISLAARKTQLASPWVRRVLGHVIQDADENPGSTVADLARRNVIRQVSGIRESPYLRPPPQSTGRTITIIGYLQEENNPNLTEVVKVVLEYPAGA